MNNSNASINNDNTYSLISERSEQSSNVQPSNISIENIYEFLNNNNKLIFQAIGNFYYELEEKKEGNESTKYIKCWF